jgi:hypothetical protein
MHEYEDYFAAPWPPEREFLCGLRDEVCTDAHDVSEQVGAFACVFDDWAELPVRVALSQGTATFLAVEDRDQTISARVALPSGNRISVPLEDVLPVEASPAAFLVGAYRLWLGLEPLPRVPSSDEPTAAADRESVRDHLLALQVDELVELLSDLYDAGSSNRVAIHTKLGFPAPAPDEMLLAKNRAKIARYVAPGPDDSFQLEATDELVNRYQRQTADRRGTTDLLVHCLESGNQAIGAYGHLFEEFYSTMIEIAYRCVDLLEADDSLLQEFRPRLRAVLAGAAGVGCGYEDMLFEALVSVALDEEEEDE